MDQLRRAVAAHVRQPIECAVKVRPTIRAMRILYHHRTLGDGAEGIHVREMVRAFRELGHEVKVIGPAGEPGESLSAPSSVRTRWLFRIKRAMPAALFELAEIAYAGYAFLDTWLEIKRFKPDFVYQRYITYNAGPILAGKVSGTDVLLEVNAPLALERAQQADERLWLTGFARSMERWICSNAARTIVVSTPLKEYLESIGVPQGQCFVMPNGADPRNFLPRAKSAALLEELRVPAKAFVVGFTGVLRGWHGLDLLLEAMAELVRTRRNVFLLIVGGGPYQSSLEERVRELGLEQSVRITGRVDHAAVPNHVALFDVAVSPRATFYASPMKVLEYMALAKPVVVPRTQNFLDIVDDGVNGVTFEEGSARALAAELADLYESRERCETLGAKAREKIERRLNWRTNALQSCQLLRAEAGSPLGVEHDAGST